METKSTKQRWLFRNPMLPKQIDPKMLLRLESLDRKEGHMHRESTLRVLSTIRNNSESMSEVIAPIASDALNSKRTAKMISNLLMDSKFCRDLHGQDAISGFAVSLAEDYHDVLCIRLPYGPGTSITIAHYVAFYLPAAEAIFLRHPEMFDFAISSDAKNPRPLSNSLILWLAEHEPVLGRIADSNPILLFRPVYGSITQDPPKAITLAEALIESRLEGLAEGGEQTIDKAAKSIKKIIAVESGFSDVVMDMLSKANEDVLKFERLGLSARTSETERLNMLDHAERLRRMGSGIREVLRRVGG